MISSVCQLMMSESILKHTHTHLKQNERKITYDDEVARRGQKSKRIKLK